jgi:hypothetical protein
VTPVASYTSSATFGQSTVDLQFMIDESPPEAVGVEHFYWNYSSSSVSLGNMRGPERADLFQPSQYQVIVHTSLSRPLC